MFGTLESRASRRSILRLVLLVSILLALSVSLSSCGTDGTDKPEAAAATPAKTVDVPDVTGEDAETGKSDIEDAGPDLTVEYSEEPDALDGCTVSDQDETGDIAPDATVTLTLECEVEVEVPDVTGQAATEAESAIEAVGELTATYDSEPDDESACTVADQDPAGGEAVATDTEVTLTLECGVEVPDVTGQGAEEAKSTLEASGELTASYDVEPDDASVCTVTDQDPAGGETVDSGTDVTLTLECEEAPEDYGTDDPSDTDPGYEDAPDDYSTPDSPTTEDFGEGTGSVGPCEDGTLSDSIGRPGACSHHGGVR